MTFPARIKFIVITAVLIVATVNFTRSSLNLLKNNKRLEEAKAEIGALEAQKGMLEAQISYKKTEEYIEERARNDLNLVKPNEKIYVIARESKDEEGDKNTILGVSTEFESDSSQKGTWYQWLRLFF